MANGNVDGVFADRMRAGVRWMVFTGAIALTSCVHKAAETPAARAQALDVSSFAEADSARMARLLIRECRTAKIRSACYEEPLVEAAAAGRVRLAMGALGQIGAVDVDVKRDGHVYAHAIGIAAGKLPGDIAQTFSQCSESFQSGCYHGVIQARFAALDSIGPREVNAVCEPFRANETQRWIRFQCVHGIGHGLTSLNDHDLAKGLAGCDLLKEWWDKQSCYGGAFMENIVNVTNPHHPASTLTHHGGQPAKKAGDHAQAEMAAMDHEHPARFKAVDAADPHYPCSALGERYQSACYQMQTSVMLYNNKGDIAGAALACDGAPRIMRATCYSSLGRDISSYSLQDHAEGIRMCSLGTPRYQPWCYFGLVKNIIDLNARPSEGIALCREIPIASGKLICYVGVGEQVAFLGPDVETRRSMCSTSEAGMIDACLFGARVKAEAPAGLSEVWGAINSQ